MIIGNNNGDNKFNKDFLNTNTKFDNRMKQYNNNKQNNTNIFVKSINEQIHSNVNSKDDMYNKSLAMLNERLNKGLISMDEFTKQVNMLARKRK